MSPRGLVQSNMRSFPFIRFAAMMVLAGCGFAAALDRVAAADRATKIIRSSNPAVLYGLNFNAATATSRPPAALRRAGEVADSLRFNIKFSGPFPQPAQVAVREAARIWSALLTSRVPVTIEAGWTSLGPAGASGIPLGSTHVWFWSSDRPPGPLATNTWYPTALARKYAGSEVDSAHPDMQLDFNSDVKNWYFGTDGLTPIGQYDFLTVALQQMTHGLGFTGSMTVNAAGVGSFGMAGQNGQTYPVIFDTFVRATPGSLTDGITFVSPSTQIGTQLQGHKVFLGGTATKHAYGGVDPLLFSPLPWNEGASYVHLDEFTYPPGDPNAFMTPFLGRAEPIHNPGPIVLGLLTDIGW
jgi:hypothetical protein